MTKKKPDTIESLRADLDELTTAVTHLAKALGKMNEAQRRHDRALAGMQGSIETMAVAIAGPDALRQPEIN